MIVVPYVQEQQGTSPTPTTLGEWRERILRRFLILLIPISAITISINIGSFVSRGVLHERIPLVSAEIISIIALTLVAIMQQWPYVLRAIVPLLLLYTIGMLDTLQNGISSNGRFLFLISTLFTVIFFGARSGGGMFALSLTTMILILVVFGHGELDLGIASAINQIFIFILLCIIGVVPTAQLIKGLAGSTSQASSLAHIAQTARLHAEEQAQALSRSNTALKEAEQRLLDLVATLETPTVALAPGLLLAPIIGSLDSRRMQRLQAQLLQDIHEQRASMVIIDLTGITTVDTQVTQTLIHAARAIRMLGCQVVLTGISAAVASTITQLGITLQGITIARSPQEVLERTLLNKIE